MHYHPDNDVDELDLWCELCEEIDEEFRMIEMFAPTLYAAMCEENER